MKHLCRSAWLLLVASASVLAQPATSKPEGHQAATPAIGFVMAQVGPGSGVMISSLNIPPGSGPRRMLVRAAGPALASLGVERPLGDPTIAVFKLDGTEVAANDNWDAGTAAAVDGIVMAGVLPFAPGSKDAALLISLEPGHYTLHAASGGGDTGTVMVEVYDVTAPSGATPTTAPAAVPTLNSANRSAGAGQLLFHLPLKDGFKNVAGTLTPLRMRGVTIRDGAAWFDGKDSELVLPHQPLDKRAFAVALWVKVENKASGVGIVEQRSANRRNEHLHLVLRDSAPRCGFYLNDLQTQAPLTPARGWTHLVFQYNGRQQQVWIDGERVGARRAGAYAGKEGEFSVGRAPRWSNVPAEDFKGGMQDLRVYARALSPVEIAALAAKRP